MFFSGLSPNQNHMASFGSVYFDTCLEMFFVDSRCCCPLFLFCTSKASACDQYALNYELHAAELKSGPIAAC